MTENPAGTSADELSGLAAALAPLIDELRLSVMNAVFAAPPPASFMAAGLDQATGRMLGYLRNIYPDRAVPRSAVQAVFTYQPEKSVDPELDALVAAGVLAEPEPGTLVLTGEGRACLEELHHLSDTVAQRQWAGVAGAVAAAGPLVDRALRAGWETGGETFRLMAPDRLPMGMSETGLLAERLSGLRFHRFDAHIAAWRARGYQAVDLPSLDETERAAIEVETNRRAGVPYAVLTESERPQLLDGLAELGRATRG